MVLVPVGAWLANDFGMMRSSWFLVVLLTVLLATPALAQVPAQVPGTSATATAVFAPAWLEFQRSLRPRPAAFGRGAEGSTNGRPQRLLMKRSGLSGGSEDQDPPYKLSVLPVGAPAALANQNSSSSRERSVGRRILGAVAGGAGGFFAGGYLGAWIDGDCGGCDDPGLKGALIGAPIGAALGAVFGGLYLF